MYVSLSPLFGFPKPFVRLVNAVSLEQRASRLDIHKPPKHIDKVRLRIILWNHNPETLSLRSFTRVLSRARCCHEASCTPDCVVCRDLVFIVTRIPFVIRHLTFGLLLWWHGTRLAKILSAEIPASIPFYIMIGRPLMTMACVVVVHSCRHVVDVAK